MTTNARLNNIEAEIRGSLSLTFRLVLLLNNCTSLHNVEATLTTHCQFISFSFCCPREPIEVTMYITTDTFLRPLSVYRQYDVT